MEDCYFLLIIFERNDIMYKVLSVVNNVADIVSTDGNINELPTNYEISSSGS